MLNETYELNDDFSDELDAINDQLTVFCERTFSDSGEVVSFIEFADSMIRTKGMHLDYSDIEDIRTNLETPEAQEAVNFVIPIYKNSEQTEYNLVVTYFQSEPDSNFEIEMEVQYVWETDMHDDEFEELNI